LTEPENNNQIEHTQVITERPQGGERRLESGCFFHDFHLLNLCGRGSFGEVWRVEDISGKVMALKIVSKKLLGHHWLREFTGIKNFRKIEANHPSLVQIYHVGEDEESFYYSMELADPMVGGAAEYSPLTLAALLETGRLPAERIIDMTLPLLDGIEVLHKSQMAHRDIKPANIIFVNGEPKLSDVGLVASCDHTMSFAGTPGFIPPEEFTGGSSGRNKELQSDLYALGKVIYCAMSGNSPGDFPNLPGDFTLMGINKKLNRLVCQACNKNPSSRLNDIAGFRRQLEEMKYDIDGTLPSRSGGMEDLSHEPRSGWRLHWSLQLLLAIGVATVVLVLVAKWYILPSEKPVPAAVADDAKKTVPVVKPVPAPVAPAAPAIPAAAGEIIIEGHTAGGRYAGSPAMTLYGSVNGRPEAIQLCSKQRLYRNTTHKFSLPVVGAVDSVTLTAAYHDGWEMAWIMFRLPDGKVWRFDGFMGLSSRRDKSQPKQGCQRSITFYFTGDNAGKILASNPFDKERRPWEAKVQGKAVDPATVASTVVPEAKPADEDEDIEDEPDVRPAPKPFPVTKMLGSPWTVPGVGLALVYVAPGVFRMGSADMGHDNERPVHTVKISRGFWLGKYELTQAEYASLVTGYQTVSEKERMLPVVNVSWHDAVAFCRKLTDREKEAGRLPDGYVYRLPTEAEWEYAARGGAQTNDYRWSGSDYINEIAWNNSNSGRVVHPVGQLKPNELGLYDMSGNVWEWCADNFVRYPESEQVDPFGFDGSLLHTSRGGGIFNPAFTCRVARRDGISAEQKYKASGFRVALAPDLPPAGATPAPVALTSPATVGDEKVVPDLGMVLVLVKPGNFVMGAVAGAASEKPQHKVTISSEYWIGKYEVTREEYFKIKSSSTKNSGEARLPINHLCWNDAAAYCEALTSREKAAGRLPVGYVYRLPTEAEWEYAARGGQFLENFRYSGSDELGKVAWYVENSGDRVHPVGQKKPNSLGLYDMSGNVNEFCSDWLGTYPAGDQNDPTGPENGSGKILKGGGYRSTPFENNECRPSGRLARPVTNEWGTFGFRVVLGKPLATPAQTVKLDAPVMTGTTDGEREKLARKQTVDALMAAGNAALKKHNWQSAEKAYSQALAVSGYEHYKPAEIGLRMAKNHFVPKKPVNGDITSDPTAVSVEAPRNAEVKVIPDLNLGMVYVAPGSMELGSAKTGKQLVTLSRGYWIGRCEVTQEQYIALMQNNPSYYGNRQGPVERVDWNMANAFCAALTAREQAAGRLPDGMVYRLPTSAEWEYAARGGSDSKKYQYCGGNDLEAVAWVESNSAKLPHPAGQKTANELGLFDMSGNVWEWCSDWQGRISSESVDPLGPDTGTKRIVHGGCFMAGYPDNYEPGGTEGIAPDRRLRTLGFRVALGAPLKEGTR